MENISVGLKWVIGVIVTILIIAAGVSIYLVINGYFTRAQEQTLSQSQLITQAEFSGYDNKDVSGQDVLNVASRYAGRPNFSVRIKNNESATGFFASNNYNKCYVAPTDPDDPVDVTNYTACLGGKIPVSTMQDQTQSANYVNPTATFASKIYKDKNGEVCLIEFIQKPN
ncbi:hypothetical protein K0T92_10680 [Paenibacillus oenotherae]|uniref:Uncharacterized protein n=1 Tax=Paenibacillus oenotherae TaxID=1435645 RepID=A0ABS7D606_9BACL|nr:hypothetical protein [Paenibacillus oenotherae]MBW7475213.1 hypothetical protein [Paenibacillus oenotherae]